MIRDSGAQDRSLRRLLWDTEGDRGEGLVWRSPEPTLGQWQRDSIGEGSGRTSPTWTEEASDPGEYDVQIQW